MARKTLSQRLAFEGAEEFLAALEDIGKTGTSAFGQVAKGAESADAPSAKLSKTVVRLRGEVAELSDEGRRLGRTWRDTAAEAKKFGTELATMGRRAAIAATAVTGAVLAATAAATALARSGAQAADTAAKTAEGLGLTVGEYGRLEFAAGQAGLASTQFGAGLNALNTKVAAALKGTTALTDNLGLHPERWRAALEATITGTGALDKQAESGDRAAQSLRRLGIQLRDPQGQVRSGRELLLDLADAFKDFPAGIEKAGLAASIFGEDLGRRMLPFLNQGRAGIVAFEREASRLGVVFTAEQARIATAFVDAEDRLRGAVRGIKHQIGLLFAPALTERADKLTESLVANRQAILGFAQGAVARAGAFLDDLFALIEGRDRDVGAKWILDARDAIIAFARAARAAFESIIVPAFRGLLAIFDELAVAVNQAFGTEFTGRTLLVAAAVAQLLGVFSSLGAVVLATTALLVGVLPDALALLQDVVAALQGRDQDVNAKWILDWRDAILAFAADVKSAFTDILVPAFEKLIAIADVVAAGINSVFGTDISGGALLIAVVVGSWLGLFTKVAAILVIVNAGIGIAVALMNGIALAAAIALGVFVGWPALIGAAIVGVIALVVLFWDDIVDLAESAWNKITELWSGLGDVIGGFADAMADRLVSAFKTAINFISGALRQLIALAKSAVSFASELFSSPAQAGGASGGGSGFAGGGAVSGPGTATSDSITARLSAGEFVQQAKAVRYYGQAFMAALNAGRIPRAALPGFNLGGLVGGFSDGLARSLSSLAPAPIPAFATGGLVTGGGGGAKTPVNLYIGGQRFPVLADDDVAEALTRIARRDQRASAGKTPARYRR